MIAPALSAQASDSKSAPSSDEAKAALETLRRLVEHAPAEAAAIGLSNFVRSGDVTLNHDYPNEFVVDADYKATLPDLQNGPTSLIRGAHTTIQHVGISNFRLPLEHRQKDGGLISLETSVTGSQARNGSQIRT